MLQSKKLDILCGSCYEYMMGESFKDKFLSYTKKTIKISSEAADLAMRFQEKQTVLGFMALSSRVLNVYTENFSPNPRTFFESWDFLKLGELEAYIINFLNQCEMLDVHEKTYQGHAGILHMVDLGDNFKIGWSTTNSYIYGPFIPNGQCHNTTRQKIGDYLCKSLGNLALHPNKSASNSNESLELKKDELVDFMPSDKGKEIYEKSIKPFLEANFKRAILFYGPPGSGKSYMMKYIGMLAGGRTLRIGADNLWLIRDVRTAIGMLRPDVILIDDLDRATAPSVILDRIDEVRSMANLVLVSANDLDKFDAAVLRPSRFDNLIEIKQLDQKTIDKIIGNIDADTKKKLDSLPVAYIHEFSKINQILGIKMAIDELDNMIERSEFIKKKFEEKEKVK